MSPSLLSTSPPPLSPGPEGGGASTSQGRSYGIFQKALARLNQADARDAVRVDRRPGHVSQISERRPSPPSRDGSHR